MARTRTLADAGAPCDRSRRPFHVRVTVNGNLEAALGQFRRAVGDSGVHHAAKRHEYHRGPAALTKWKFSRRRQLRAVMKRQRYVASRGWRSEDAA